MTQLNDAIKSSQRLLKAALAKAEEDLAGCRARCAAIEQEIAEAQRLLGVAPAVLPLHEAMLTVLRDADRGMAPVELREAVNASGLYRGGRVGINQLHARLGNRLYRNRFRKENGLIYPR